MRKLLSILLMVAVAVVTLFTGCRTLRTTKNSIRIGLVTDIGGRGDKSLNDGALRGLEMWAAGKAYGQGDNYNNLSDVDYQKSLNENAADLANKNIKSLGNILPIVLESQTQKDYVPNLTRLAVDKKCRLVIAVGSTMADAVYKAAEESPGTWFALIDAQPFDPATLVPRPQLQNLTCYLFREEQAAFLAGAIAGMATRTNRIGYIGRPLTAVVDHYEAGFLAGIKTTNPNAYGVDGRNISHIDAASLSNRQEGRQIAQTMIAQKCDILFQHAGAAGASMFAILKEVGGPARGLWGIGIDADMGKNSYLYPAGTLTSSAKHVDYAVYLAVKSVVDNTYKASVVTLSMKDGGVGYAKDHVADVLSSDQLAKVENLRKMVIDGAILPPTDPEAVPAWTVPTSY